MKIIIKTTIFGFQFRDFCENIYKMYIIEFLSFVINFA